jgi:hypothetical protein
MGIMSMMVGSWQEDNNEGSEQVSHVLFCGWMESFI